MEDAQPLPQLRADLRVQRAERLVQQQHARLDRERAGERHALALAAGELVRVAVLVAGEPDDAEQLADLLSDLRLGQLAHGEAERDVVAHGHVLEGRVVLEHEADAPALRRDARRVLAVDLDGAAVGTLQPGDDAQQRGLAGARGTEQRCQRPIRHLERDVVERRERSEVLGDVANGDHESCSSRRGLILVMTSSVSSAITARRVDAA